MGISSYILTYEKMIQPIQNTYIQVFQCYTTHMLRLRSYNVIVHHYKENISVSSVPTCALGRNRVRDTAVKAGKRDADAPDSYAPNLK